jgi:hypothetical protein
MAKRGRRSRGLSDGLTGLFLGLVGIILIAGLGGAYWFLKSSRPILDSETNCPKSSLSGIHVIMFDRSDPISEQQAQRIRQAIEKFKNEAPFGMRFDLYTFQGDTQHALQPKLRICALGKPSEANAWIENPELVRRRYETRFTAVLDQTVAELLRGSQEKNSPIIESLRAAAISSFGSMEAGQIPLRLTMISDMVQNTPLSNQFQTEPNFQQLSRTVAWPTLQPQLKGADINILYLLRLSALRKGMPIQNRGHQLFWEQLIAGSGGRLLSIDPL